ncbi:hypothetical protein, partial [Streptomyces sp. NPDC101166]
MCGRSAAWTTISTAPRPIVGEAQRQAGHGDAAIG